MILLPNLHLKLLKSPPIPTKKEGAFRNKTSKILYRDSQFYWTSPDGGWKTFNHDGYLLRYGTEEGTIANLIYVDDKLTTIQDRYEQTIYTYEYEDNKITITDYSGRKVVYGVFPVRLLDRPFFSHFSVQNHFLRPNMWRLSGAW
jgi:hypothetical protein